MNDDTRAWQVGIHLAQPRSSVCRAATDTTASTPTPDPGDSTSTPTVVALRDGRLVVGADADNIRATRAQASCSDVLDRFGGRAMVAVWDTYFSPQYLVSEVVGHLVAGAGGVARRNVVVAHPASWTDRQRDLLADVVRSYGPAGVAAVVDAEAAAWAPAPGPRLDTGDLVVIVDLGTPTGVDLLRAGATGYRHLSHVAVGGGAAELAAAATTAIENAGHELRSLRAARAVGAGAGDERLVAELARALGGPVHVPDHPVTAVAIGAALWQPFKEDAVVEPDSTADVIDKLRTLAGSTDDAQLAVHAGLLRREIWEATTMGVTPAANLLRRARTLVADHRPRPR